MSNARFSWDALLVASIVFAAGALAQSQPSAWADEPAEPEGRIVEVNSGAETELPKVEDKSADQPAQPTYWIGIHGRVIDSALLRTQFQLAEDTGVVIENVVKGSPADKAGLRQHDIILRANGDSIQGMEDLASVVAGSEGKPIELQIIRLAKDETISVTPEVRPEGVEQPAAGFPGMGQFGDEDAMRRWMEQLPGMKNLPGGLRMFGPGVIINGQRFDWNAVPNGVAVTIQRSGDGPAKITVKKGDQTWNIVGDDAGALEQLPEDVRGYVQQLLGGGNFGNFNFNFQQEMERLLPDHLGNLVPPMPPVADMDATQDEVLKKMQDLERRLEDLQKRLDEGESAE